MADTKAVILFIAIPLLLVFFVLCAIYFYFKFCRGHCCRNTEDTENLLDDPTLTASYDSMSLIDKVNLERKQTIHKTKETAFVYLQLYFRSNPHKSFQLVEQLHNIGSQPETERSWFLCKQTIENVNKSKIIYLNALDMAKKTRLSDIAESMSMNAREFEAFVGEFMRSIRHPHVLAFDAVELDFDKDRVLFIQDYSRDGSLRDLLRRSKPEDTWETKTRPLESKPSLGIKTIREYTKQIIAGLMYLNCKLGGICIDNLHSGNVILALKKRICILTGFESVFLLKKSRVDILNEKHWIRVVKSYLMKIHGSNENANEIGEEFAIRKAKNDLELKEIVQVLRIGIIVLEMCLGIECEELIPSESYLTELSTVFKQHDANEITTFLRFIFFNKLTIEDKNGKPKDKFLIPNLSEVYAHPFLASVKLKDASISTSNEVAKNSREAEYLEYFMGKREIKSRKLRRKSLALGSFSFSGSSKRLSTIQEASYERSKSIFSDESEVASKSSVVLVPPSNTSGVSQSPPPPPPPPPLQSGPPPPPPPPPPPSLNLQTPTSDRSALLTDIRSGLKLKKTVTNDRSKPII